jgi:hypothetical protein
MNDSSIVIGGWRVAITTGVTIKDFFFGFEQPITECNY